MNTDSSADCTSQPTTSPSSSSSTTSCANLQAAFNCGSQIIPDVTRSVNVQAPSHGAAPNVSGTIFQTPYTVASQDVMSGAHFQVPIMSLSQSMASAISQANPVSSAPDSFNFQSLSMDQNGGFAPSNLGHSHNTTNSQSQSQGADTSFPRDLFEPSPQHNGIRQLGAPLGKFVTLSPMKKSGGGSMLS